MFFPKRVWNAAVLSGFANPPSPTTFLPASSAGPHGPGDPHRRAHSRNNPGGWQQDRPRAAARSPRASSLYMQHANDMSGVEPVIVPGEANPNLIAQQGRLIKVTGPRVDLLDGFDRAEVQLGFRPTETAARTIANHFVAVTLPRSKAGQLLRSLRDQGVHAATAFPGQRGVAELVREVLLVED